jgi:hypothetical protein
MRRVGFESVDATLDQLLGGSALRRRLDAVHRAATAVVDPQLLQLCRARMALLIGSDEEHPRSASGESVEQAAVDLAEQMVIDVANVSDDQVTAVVRHLGPDAAATLVYALVAEEQRLRMQTLWARLGLVPT